MLVSKENTLFKLAYEFWHGIRNKRKPNSFFIG